MNEESEIRKRGVTYPQSHTWHVEEQGETLTVQSKRLKDEGSRYTAIYSTVIGS